MHTVQYHMLLGFEGMWLLTGFQQHKDGVCSDPTRLQLLLQPHDLNRVLCRWLNEDQHDLCPACRCNCASDDLTRNFNGRLDASRADIQTFHLRQGGTALLPVQDVLTYMLLSFKAWSNAGVRV